MEIYEGDIVSTITFVQIDTFSFFDKFIYVVEFENGTFGIRNKTTKEVVNHFISECEVIGNIYEDSHLLGNNA